MKGVVGDPDLEGTCETLSNMDMQILVSRRWWFHVYHGMGSELVPKERPSDGRR